VKVEDMLARRDALNRELFSVPVIAKTTGLSTRGNEMHPPAPVARDPILHCDFAIMLRQRSSMILENTQTLDRLQFRKADVQFLASVVGQLPKSPDMSPCHGDNRTARLITTMAEEHCRCKAGVADHNDFVLVGNSGFALQKLISNRNMDMHRMEASLLRVANVDRTSGLSEGADLTGAEYTDASSLQRLQT